MLSYRSHKTLVEWIALISALWCSQAAAQNVIFSEVMYNPPGDKPEYIEIVNNTATPYDFADWKLSGGVNYTFPAFSSGAAAASFLGPHERILVASVSEADLRAAYSSIPAGVRIYGPWEGGVDEAGVRTDGFLSNSGETLTLRDKNGSFRCRLSFGDDAPWPVAADGLGHSLHIVNPNRLMDDWRNWRASAELGGSPGAPDPSPSGPALRLSEVSFDADGKLAWVELYNAGGASIDLNGMGVATTTDLSDRVALSGAIAPGAYVAQDLNLVADGNVKICLVDGGNKVLDATVIKRSTVNTLYQTYPAGSSEWFRTSTASRGAVNDPDRQEGIVINEIMYAPPIGGIGEFIEIYNRSDAAIDLSGWSLNEAVDFVFPSGTSLAAGGYLAVVSDLDYFKQHYGAEVNALGNFDGGLSNDGERIRLLDASRNLADEVDYKVGGAWPWKSDDFGSSIELVHPDMDNNLASAWRDSDESAKATSREYSAQKDYSSQVWTPARTDQELHFHLVGEGYVILEDVEFKKPTSLFNPVSENLLTNPDKQSTTGNSRDGWLFQGTHALGFYQDGAVHIIATGRGDNRPNRVEIDMAALGTSANLNLSFKARWVYGKPRLIAQTVDHGWSHEFLIDEPTNLGTPGAANSMASEAPVPQVDDLLHSPAVPKPSDNVLITAKVSSVTPLQTVQVAYIEDSSSGNRETIFRKWVRVPMNDEGLKGDAVSGDGTYTAELTDANIKTDGDIVVFYVEAIAEDGSKRLLPAEGSERPALYVVDDRDNSGVELRTVRMVMSEFDTGAFGARGFSAKYNFGFPAPSNFYRNCTIIMNEEEIFYNCDLRSGGSPWHSGDRANVALKGKYKMPKSNAWRGVVKMTYDQDASIPDRRHNDRYARYWLYLFGHAANDNEFVQVILNDAAPQLREEVEPVDNGFLNRHFTDGSNGQLFRVDDEWNFTDTWSQTNRDADWDYKSPNGERAGRYHSEYMLRSREVEYDYSSIIGLFKTVSEDNYTEEEISRIVDLDQVAINWAIRGYLSDWDFQSNGRGKNTFFYRHADDGRFQYIHWDSDLGFESGHIGDQVISGRGRAIPLFHRKPYFRRKFNYYLNELMENTNATSPRVSAWMDAEDTATSEISMNRAKYVNWDNQRISRVRTQMGAARTAAFAVTTGGGKAFNTTDDLLTLEGTADASVYEPFIEGHDEATVHWLDETTWQLSGIILAEGANALQIKARDISGKILGSLFSPKSLSITATKTNASKPIVDLNTNPDSLNVDLSQEFKLDAGDSVDPEGDTLTYTWAGSAEGVYGLSTDGATAKVTFDRPGIYPITVTVTDANGNSAQATREASVYGADGFSSFQGELESYWALENVAPLTSAFQDQYYDLADRPGFLMLRTLDVKSAPLNGAYPAILRSVPAQEDWTFQSKYVLMARQFADAQMGVLAEFSVGGANERYLFGHDQGNKLAVYKKSGTTAAVKLAEMPYVSDRATVRIRRIGTQLRFEYQVANEWQSLHTQALAADTVGVQAGLFAATNEVMSTRTGFDFAMLIQPGTVSSLQKDIRLSEIMYNPEGGQQYEYLELLNVGAQPLDLSGAYFADGIDYTFENGVTIQSGQYLVIAKDRAAFASRYGSDSALAPGAFGGQLSNGGETVTLLDSEGLLIFSVSYSDGGDWPDGADGVGSSIELIDAAGPINSADNWQTSGKVNGSPGAGAEPPSADDLDADGILDAWETQYGLNPNSAADAFQDLDNDGWNNRNEFLSGTAPNDSMSYLSLGVTRVSAEKVTLSFNGLLGRNYSLEYADDLSANQWAKIADVPSPANAGLITQEAPAPAASTQRFYRLRVGPAN